MVCFTVHLLVGVGDKNNSDGDQKVQVDCYLNGVKVYTAIVLNVNLVVPAVGQITSYGAETFPLFLFLLLLCRVSWRCTVPNPCLLSLNAFVSERYAEIAEFHVSWDGAQRRNEISDVRRPSLLWPRLSAGPIRAAWGRVYAELYSQQHLPFC